MAVTNNYFIFLCSVSSLLLWMLSHDSLRQMEVLEYRFPDILVVGVKKCGTGAIIEQLGIHPQISAPAYTIQENQYYARDWIYSKGIEHYVHKMPLAYPDQLVITKTPGLVDIPHNTTFLTLLHRDKPDIKLLFVVKNPIERIIGDIVHEYSQGAHEGEKMPEIDSIILNTAGHISAYGFSGLDEAVKYLSDYPLQLQMVREVFPSEHIHVIDGENMIKDPLTEIRKVETFLGITQFYSEEHFYFPEGSKFPCFRKDSASQPRCMQGDKGRDHPVLKTETLNHLRSHFKPKMEEFRRLTGIHYEL